MYKKIVTFAAQILKAIHNKDYSVVKTFRAGTNVLALAF